MRVLIARDHLQERGARRAERQARGGGTVVERGLQVLECERVVEDADVALAERSRGAPAAGRQRGGSQRRQNCAAAHDRAAGDSRLLQKAQARVAGYLVGRFCDRAVDVDLVKIDLIAHVLLLSGYRIAAGRESLVKPSTSKRTGGGIGSVRYASSSRNGSRVHTIEPITPRSHRGWATR